MSQQYCIMSFADIDYKAEQPVVTYSQHTRYLLPVPVKLRPNGAIQIYYYYYYYYFIIIIYIMSVVAR